MKPEEAITELQYAIDLIKQDGQDWLDERDIPILEAAISALEKQIPKKPTETIDRAWGIPRRQAVCPECDCYLGQIHFIGDGKRKIAYCEICGQAVDFSEWKEGE